MKTISFSLLIPTSVALLIVGIYYAGFTAGRSVSTTYVVEHPVNLGNVGKGELCLLPEGEDATKAMEDCFERSQLPRSHTLVIRDNRGVTTQISGLPGADELGGLAYKPDGSPWLSSCQLLAIGLKSIPEIESAECFK